MSNDFVLEDIEPGQFADVMPAMSADEFASLKHSIERNGFDDATPIVVDSEGNIVDGHHRYRACSELGVEPAITVTDDPSMEQAIRSNVARRNLSDGAIRDAVVAYLQDHYDGERTQEAVAEDLGVHQSTVSRAMEKYAPDNFTREEKRGQVSEYLDRNPGASNREAADAVEADVSHATVGNWRDEWTSPPGDGEDTHASDTSSDEAEDESADMSDDTECDIPDQDADASVRFEDDVGTGKTNTETESAPTSRTVGYVDNLETEVGELEDKIEHLREANDRKDARVDELETVIQDLVRAVNNQDAEAVQTVADRAEDVLE